MPRCVRKLLAGLVALLVALCVAIPAQAASPDVNLDLPSAYLTASSGEGSTLCTFTRSPDVDLTSYEAELLKGGSGFSQEGSVEKAVGQGVPAFYYILVDGSGSMQPYASRVRELVAELVGNGAEGTIYSLGTFGSGFETLQEATTDGNTILGALDQVTYQESWTEPYSAIQQAVQAQAGMRTDAESLMSVVLVTDGLPDVDPDSSVDVQELESETVRCIAGARDIVLHSICLGSWDADLRNVLSAGSGRCLSVGEGDDAQAADSILSYSDDLYRAEFHSAEVTDGGFDVQVRFDPTSGEGDSYITQTASDAPVLAVGSDGTGTEGDTALGSMEASSSDDGGSSVQGGGLSAWIIVALVVALAVVAVLVVLAGGGKRSHATGKSPSRHAGSAAKVPVPPERACMVAHVEVLQGNALRDVAAVPLDGGVVFGRATSCDLPFDDRQMLAEHGRLFLRGDQPFVEPLSGDAAVYLNGMRIFGPNPLRNGDVLEAGGTQMRVTLSPQGSMAYNE